MKFVKKVLSLSIIFLILVLFCLCNKTFAEGIKITSPVTGDTVIPGESVTINVEVLEKTDVKSVIITSSLGIKNFSSSPFRWNVIIPLDKIGLLSIGAVGEGPNGEFFYDEITLIVIPNASLEAIIVSPKEIYFESPEEKIQIAVLGTYSGGTTAYVSPSGMGTTFVSSDTSIAVVDENGLVVSKGNGKCKITISNSGQFIDVPVEVSMPEIIQASIDINPKTLYLKSKEKYIVCYIELSQDYFVQDINIESIALNEAVSCEINSAQIGDYNNNGVADLMVKFDRQNLWYFLERGERVPVAISGKVGDKYFRGIDIIKILNEAPTISFAQFSLKHWRIHWEQGKHDKNKFQLSGRIDLPDDYTLDMLQKKGTVTIAVEKKDGAPFSQTTTLDFKQHGPIWHYKASKAQNGTEPLDIEKMLIFWQPEGSQDKPDKQGHAGKYHGKRAGWFMIQGNINISDADQAALLPKAVIILNIPVENITTAGALESTASVDFTVNQNRWLYNAAPHRRWQDWQENWWEKVKEGKKD